MPEQTSRAKSTRDTVANSRAETALDTKLLLKTLTAFKKGDFSVRLPSDWTGESGRIADTLNDVLDINDRLAREMERVSRVVGREGKIAQRAIPPGAQGSWVGLIESVNTLIDDLVQPTTEMSRVIGAVANGDLSQMMALEVDGRPLKGEFLRMVRLVNAMVTQLGSFASEVTRVTREVGTEGKLGGEARVKGVAGAWKDLIDSVNFMAGNLTAQVRNIADVTTAVANGDLSKKITVDVKGEILELKNTVNRMVDQLNSFASEVTRVAREVGAEGKLGGQAEVKDVGGTWRDLTESVNSMARNLTAQVRNIADVTTAVANGDLSKKITVDVKGEILELKDTINIMVDQLNSFASEVTRVAREVGTEGRLGGQAVVKDVGGTWKDLTDSVNFMAGNLTTQVRNIADVTTAVANGDLSKKITVDVRGEILELKNTINRMVDQLNSFASEVTRVAREVGTEGRLGGQAVVKDVGGTWKDLTDSVNSMAGNLTSQVRNIAEVTTAVANGDLSKKITVDVKGEILELKNTVNRMVDQLNSFASEVTRVAREVGAEGELGGQAQAPGVGGVWKDLTDSVNFMAGNLTTQVRGIAQVVTAVANGDLKRKLTFESKGEIAELVNTINAMTDTLATFAAQVTTVAREVGVEGKLGGQANVPGASGTWRDLTDNVNQLAANLTTQVRAIAEVATAVTQGDLTRSISVEAQGEVAALKDNINEMIRNLEGTTQKNKEQDWLKTNLARFNSMLQGQRDMATVANMILSELAPLVDAKQGAFYVKEPREEGESMMKLLGGYAYTERKNLANEFRAGEGLVGQCVLEKRRILLANAPPDYIMVSSGLGEGAPLNIVVLPAVFEEEVKAVIELASFNRFSETHIAFLDQLTESIGIVINTIEANTRTERLLIQSQSLATELQSQQDELKKTNERLEQQALTLRESEEWLRMQREELRHTNEELQEKAEQLARQNAEVEAKNREVEEARWAMEEKAEQLAMTSKYKSEFLANMSHELRTPLNSMLILSRQLSENVEGNLHSKQVQFAETIRSSGADLLSLINDILDLSKVESGMMVIEAADTPFAEVVDQLDLSFHQLAADKGLEFSIGRSLDLPPAINTDPKRLQQILKNLLSNAFKFTEKGRVSLDIGAAERRGNYATETLREADQVIAFSVSDTGIGIPAEKQRIIFEAFQQADGTTSRKYGGTGLGLSISREIARLLGGEIRVASAPGEGSVFTLYLPRVYKPTAAQTERQSDGETERRRDRATERQNDNGVPHSLRPAVPPSLSPRSGDYGEIIEVADDRNNIKPGDRVALIVEDDSPFAQVLLDIAHERGFKGVVASQGAAALWLAHRYKPDAITLDIRLPDRDGWTVLDRLKHDPKTSHIPVHVITADDREIQPRRLGALTYLRKPVTREHLVEGFDRVAEFARRKIKRMLVVEGDDAQRASVVELISDSAVRITAVAAGEEALAQLLGEQFDCMALNPKLPDMSGADLIEAMRREPRLSDLPIIVYNGKGLTEQEEARLRAVADAMVVKEAASPEHLLAETLLFLHLVEASLPESKRRMLEQSMRHDPALEGRRVLIVDDDVRNIFALTSALETYDIKVLRAENGRAGIEALKTHHDIDLVLMDIMMPGMDGYETIRAIRRIEKFKDLPIIALTARAMKTDRDKCIEAGASDYIAKPLDMDHLLSMLRVWLRRRKGAGSYVA
jgi:CheY-like chemotaxis protein/HAMP domain-containing protein/signal transduction histidine kinase